MIRPINSQSQSYWQQLVTGCQQGLPHVQEQLYRECYPTMMKICNRYAKGNDADAGAMYNAAMLKVFQQIHQFTGAGELQAWIRRIVVNACIDHWRGGIRYQQKVVSEDSAELLPVIPEVYNRIGVNELMSIINELPTNTALVFNLFAVEGYKHWEIGEILGISPGTSKWHVNEARRLLISKLDQLSKKKYLANAI